MSDDIVWEEPPDAVRGANTWHRWVEALAPLMERPGVWARIVELPYHRATRQAYAFRHREVVIPDGRWEFTSRKAENGNGCIYGRYLGPEKAGKT